MSLEPADKGLSPCSLIITIHIAKKIVVCFTKLTRQFFHFLAPGIAPPTLSGASFINHLFVYFDANLQSFFPRCGKALFMKHAARRRFGLSPTALGIIPEGISRLNFSIVFILIIQY
jgi:hypothetical protein